MITQSKTGFTHLSWSHLSGPCSAHSQSPRAETFFCETPGRSHHYAQVSALVWLWAHSSRASRIINPSVTVIHLNGTLAELRAALIFRCRNITEFKIHMQWLPRWDSTPYVSGFASETGSRCDSVDSSSNLDLFFLIESSWLGVKTESRSWGVWGRVQYIPALKSRKLVKHFQKSSCHITTTSYKLHPVLKKKTTSNNDGWNRDDVDKNTYINQLGYCWRAPTLEPNLPWDVLQSVSLDDHEDLHKNESPRFE